MASSVIDRGRTVKVSTTLAERDLVFIENYANRHGLPSRAAGFHAAISALREKELEAQYEEAYHEWYISGEAEVWECVSGDGIESE